MQLVYRQLEALQKCYFLKWQDDGWYVDTTLYMSVFFFHVGI